MAAWKLMDAGADVSIVNPSRVRHYALSMGQLAKTDPIDAGVIGDFAAAAHPERSEKPTKELKMLEEKIAETISTNAPMKEKNRRIQRIKGLGKICAATLLAHIPEINYRRELSR